MDTELLDLMTQTIQYAAPSGTYTDGGKPNYGSDTDYVCRIDPAADGEKIIRMDSGETRVAKWKIFVNTTARLDATGRITLPSGYIPQQPPILSSALVQDDVTGNHVVIMV